LDKDLHLRKERSVGYIKGKMFFEMLEEVVHAACNGRVTK